eukprot:1542041-Pleurochrysis_carterae.AAC.1
MVPWQGFRIEDIVKGAKVLADSGEEEWLMQFSSIALDAAALLVQAVISGRLGVKGDGQKCPAGGLRGR